MLISCGWLAVMTPDVRAALRGAAIEGVMRLRQRWVLFSSIALSMPLACSQNGLPTAQ
jgi:hypothetical protein